MSRDGGSIGENMRKARKMAGLTQVELADMAGVSIGSIQGYEQERYIPKGVNLRKIASALGIRYSELDSNVLENDADLMNQTFTRGYQAGYEAAKKEVFERMQAFLETDAK